MKKIAIVSWDMSILGGINQVIATLAKGFCERYEVHIISLVKEKEKTAYEFPRNVHEVYYILERNARGREVISEGKKKLKRYLKNEGISTVFLMGFQVSLPTILMAGCGKIKYVFCDHEALMSRWKERKITFVRFLSALFSKKVVTLTKDNASDYRRKFHLSEKKVGYIYNSVSERVLENRAKYDEASKTILSVGRFSPEKGYEMLVDVAKEVFKDYSDWQWYVYGNGETFEQIKKKIQEENLESNLILKGEVSDVSRIYGQGALYVLTSYREGLPLVLLEAKANHLPCVSFDIVSGPREIIRPDIDGILVKPFDTKTMAEKIKLLINDKELRCKMAEAADGNLADFSSDTVMKQWFELIDYL